MHVSNSAGKQGSSRAESVSSAEFIVSCIGTYCHLHNMDVNQCNKSTAVLTECQTFCESRELWDESAKREKQASETD